MAQTGSESSAPIRNISDTARWAAVYRAKETERPRPLFKDPFARRLAGERGEDAAQSLDRGDHHLWSWTTRTVLYDEFIAAQIGAGADTVINLAAGLDARPYRMSLPKSLTWIEIDLPDLLDYKERVLAGEKPHCQLERIRLDLSDAPARRTVFERIGARTSRAVVLTEGLIIYLNADEVASLARDLAAQPAFTHWVLDICSPGLMAILSKNMGAQLDKAGAPFKFAPPEGPGFFIPHGWKPLDVRGMLKSAARLRLLPWFLRLAAVLPESTGRQGRRPWGGVCLMDRA